MRKLLTYLLPLFIFSSFQSADKIDQRNLKHKDFSKGETLTYVASYGMFNAGEAVIHLDQELHTVNTKSCYKVSIDAKSIGAFSFVMNIKDTWQSYIDTATIVPQKFFRDITEGPVASKPYRLVETTIFDHNKQKAQVKQTKNGKDSNNEYQIPKYAQDLISGYYYLRAIDFDGLSKGDTIKMDAFFEDKVYDFNILYLGKDIMRSKFGKMETYLMSPIMPDNSLFDGENSVKFWVTCDENRVPLKIEAEMFVGSVEIDLVKYNGLKSKLTRYKKK
jgi:hypothetical protein